jgi:hypothetical protein
VPLWKVQVPAHIEQPAASGGALSGYIDRRAEELNLTPSETPQGSQDPRHCYGTAAFACSGTPAVDRTVSAGGVLLSREAVGKRFSGVDIANGDAVLVPVIRALP